MELRDMSDREIDATIDSLWRQSSKIAEHVARTLPAGPVIIRADGQFEPTPLQVPQDMRELMDGLATKIGELKAEQHRRAMERRERERY